MKRAKEARILVDRLVDEPYQYVKSQRVKRVESQKSNLLHLTIPLLQESGLDEESMVATLINDCENEGILDERCEFLIKNAGGQIFGGTSSALFTLYQEPL